MRIRRSSLMPRRIMPEAPGWVVIIMIIIITIIIAISVVSVCIVNIIMMIRISNW